MRKIWIAAAGCFVFATPSFSQNNDKAAHPPEEAQVQSEVLLAKLAGIRVVDDEAKIISQGPVTPGITIENLPALNDATLQQQLTVFLGKSLTQANLSEIANDITRWYTSKGLPYVRVAFPAGQNLQSGVLQIAVTENPTILPNLAGIRLIDNAAKIEAQGASAQGIIIVGLPLLDAPEFRAIMQSFIGKPLTQRSLLSLEQAIVAFYGQHDRPYMDVAVPSGQDISNGTIQLVVTESRAGKITIAKNQWFSSDLLKSELEIRTGDPISAESLRGDADWLDQNPFHHQELTQKTLADGTYHVTIETQRGAAPATTDIAVNVPDQFPARFSLGYDNSSPPALTRNRWTVGADWGNAFWLDHQLTYRFTTSDDFWGGKFSDPTFASHFLSYSIPLPWHDRLTIFGSYVRAMPRIGPDIDITGVNGGASLRYSVGLPALFGVTSGGVPVFSQELQFGYDFKSGNNDLEFGGFQVFNATTEVDQFLLAYNAALNDRFGQTSLANNLVYSPGHITGKNTDAQFQAQLGTPFPRANYLYDHLTLTRITVFSPDYDLGTDLDWVKKLTSITKVVAQVSNVDLLPSEQMGIGGIDSVPGYTEHEENGSRGIQINQEFRSPAFSPSALFFDDNIGDHLQGGLSWNYANVNELKVLPGTQSTFQLESVAAGLYYTAQPNVDLRLIFGRQLRKTPGAAHLGEFIHVALTLAY